MRLRARRTLVNLPVMPRRARVSFLLLALLAWMSIEVVCGAVALPLAVPACDRGGDSCAHHAAPKQTCPAAGCSLTCASLLTVALSDASLEVVPRFVTHSLAIVQQHASRARARPPVPPPRA